MRLTPEVIKSLEDNTTTLVNVNDYVVFTYPKRDSQVYVLCAVHHVETGLQYEQLFALPKVRAIQMGKDLLAHAELVNHSGPSF
jgi:hypothetical protein